MAGIVLSAALTTAPQAHADDWADCIGPAAPKVEAACSAIITEATRPPADRVRALVNRAQVYLRTGKADLALADAEAALQLDGNSVGAILTRGFVSQRRNNLDAAKADFDRAIQLDPKSAPALQMRAGLYVQQRKWQEAIADFNDAIAARPELAPSYAGRGRAYLETGQIDNA